MKRRPWIPPDEEARLVLEMMGGPQRLSACMEFLRHHFDVIQGRSQLLLTLSTLVLTITGFSGPKIAQTSLFARYSMAAGIVFVLAGMLILLLGGLRIRWTTQFLGDDPNDTIARILRYRNAKTRLYFVELTLLVIGLTAYVSAVVTYLMNG
jgi:isoprenylcysteine carboxyl methyltransferase (ICMT) family protein YpbQ